MSDTNNNNPAIACADLNYDESGNKISVKQGNYGPSKNEINTLAGMQIGVEKHTKKKILQEQIEKEETIQQHEI